MTLRPSPSWWAALGLATFALAPATSAQVPTLPAPVAAQQDVVADSYIVLFRERSFDLSEFRAAIRGGASAQRVSDIVRGLETAVERDQADFVEQVQRLGGRVTEQWWIINGCCVEGISTKARDSIAAMANVEAVQQNAIHHALNVVARNSTHHEADQANQRRTSGGALVTGSGETVAILDTGIDALYASTGKPNPAYYIGGNQNNTAGGGIQGSRLKAVIGTSGFGTEDNHGHGSHVAGSSASDQASLRGIAPGASLVGIKISNDGGSAASSWLVSGWQQVASNRVVHGIGVANNSFSGSPSLTDSIQRALDSTALNADVLITVAAGNGGTNTSSSQNAWNGLAVGALNKNSLAVASYSGRGPLSGFGRTYPDITAVGTSVLSVRLNSTSGVSYSGTSMASPMAAGGAALVRQAGGNISALETKAVLLAATKGQQNSRNTYGLGIMDCDEAVRAALNQEFGTITLQAPSQTVVNRTVTLPAGQTRIVATWMHSPGSSFDNVDIRLFDSGNNQVALDGNTLNSYEKLVTTVAAGQYRLEVRWVNASGSRSLDVAIAGVGRWQTGPPPTLTNMTPGTVTNPTPGEIVLTGTNLDTTLAVDVGGNPASSFTVISPTQLRVQVAGPAVIGQVPVSVTNDGGTSNSLMLQVQGAHPAVLAGPAFGVRGFPIDYTITGDTGWANYLVLSSSPSPSSAPGIVNLNIGNNFSDIFIIGPYLPDTRGVAGYQLVFPSSMPAILVYMQAISFSMSAPTLPLESSNSMFTSLF